MRILIIEDEPSNQYYLQAILAPYGDVDVAIDGVQGLEMFKGAASEGRPYGIALIDVALPTMDGREVTMRIRALEDGLDSVKNSVIILNSANVFSGDIEKAKSCGGDLFLEKPFTPDQLNGFLQECGFERGKLLKRG